MRYRKAPPQDGAILIMFAMVLLVMLLMIGLALDLGQVYNRRIELQDVADAAALAAAGQLNGTATGISNAASSAGQAAGQLFFQYNTQSVTWSNAALMFSNSASAPDSAWLNVASAQAAPDGLLFAKVDTGALNSAVGTVTTAFMSLISSALASTTTTGHAIAGRSSLNITPLAICAMSNTAAVGRNNPTPPVKVELVEYGFRRGVAYDLMQLNPNATAPENFLFDPIDPPGTPGLAANFAPVIVGPFICAGSVPMPRVTGGSVTVQRPFPLGSLYQQLNSRFDQYAGNLCTVNGAPPDANIKSFAYNGPVSWMAQPNGQASDKQIDTALRTKADLASPNANTPAMYGVLWSYAKPVPWSDYVAGVPEPAAGYSPVFATSNWATLYASGAPTANNYPPLLPYVAISGANFQAPSAAHMPGVRNRRVLNVPLLSCPVAAGGTASATVLAIGKFFMTVPATSTALVVEFAGVVPEQSLGGHLELYP